MSRPVLGFLAGASLVLLFSIAYDTSAQTAALEGGHRHLNFGVIVIYAFVGGAAGAALGARRGRRRD